MSLCGQKAARHAQKNGIWTIKYAFLIKVWIADALYDKIQDTLSSTIHIFFHELALCAATVFYGNSWRGSSYSM